MEYVLEGLHFPNLGVLVGSPSSYNHILRLISPRMSFRRPRVNKYFNHSTIQSHPSVPYPQINRLASCLCGKLLAQADRCCSLDKSVCLFYHTENGGMHVRLAPILY